MFLDNSHLRQKYPNDYKIYTERPMLEMSIRLGDSEALQILRNLDWERGKERQRNYSQERKECGKGPERIGVVAGS